MMNSIIESNPYRKNETMKLLGKQTCEVLFSDEAKRQVHDIAAARNIRFDHNAAMDIFILGYLYGKKGERARRRGGR